MSSCFFIGHRDAPEQLSASIYKAVIYHIATLGVSDFIVGHYGNFDRMAARAVVAAKKKYPHIRLTMLLPYHPLAHPFELADGFDGSHYPPCMEGVPMRAAIARANRYSIDHSDYLIVYARYTVGSTVRMVEYAQTQAESSLICITNLAEDFE